MKSAIIIFAASLLTGCIGAPSNPAATQPVTSVDPATTQPTYWLELPAPTIRGNDFDKLWQACIDVSGDFLFEIDRTDYRAGVLTTKALTSRQWFEFWRPDVRTLIDLQRATIANTCRIVRYEFTRFPDGTFSVSPKVLVERQTISEQRVTSVVSYNGVFQLPLKTRDQPRGTKESDEGVMIPKRYWYLIGRDAALEAALADDIRIRMRG